MTMLVDLLDDFESSVDYSLAADYAYCHAEECSVAFLDAYANASNSAYSHYFQTFAFLYRLKINKIFNKPLSVSLQSN